MLTELCAPDAPRQTTKNKRPTGSNNIHVIKLPEDESY